MTAMTQSRKLVRTRTAGRSITEEQAQAIVATQERKPDAWDRASGSEPSADQ